ncbi:hypothetical protein AAFF_G00136610 [Aldrovandia affinis]|uniref:Uncharacterized protein n=1 Tax=Aldrovandia affinis TaxID=143900 RepID=A0AAD7R0R4_9TELE|nr:hypothetical protein AAFF_G00136610 [Aldrovandia affinis]
MFAVCRDLSSHHPTTGPRRPLVAGPGRAPRPIDPLVEVHQHNSRRLSVPINDLILKRPLHTAHPDLPPPRINCSSDPHHPPLPSGEREREREREREGVTLGEGHLRVCAACQGCGSKPVSTRPVLVISPDRGRGRLAVRLRGRGEERPSRYLSS